MLSLLPYAALREFAYVMMCGLAKYSLTNWRKGTKWSIPLDCALRHMYAVVDGEWRDPETGRPHIAHAGVNCMILLYYWAFNVGENDIPDMGYSSRPFEGGSVAAKMAEIETEYRDKRDMDPYNRMDVT
jgi:hypothetical protein